MRWLVLLFFFYLRFVICVAFALRCVTLHGLISGKEEVNTQ